MYWFILETMTVFLLILVHLLIVGMNGQLHDKPAFVPFPPDEDFDLPIIEPPLEESAMDNGFDNAVLSPMNEYKDPMQFFDANTTFFEPPPGGQMKPGERIIVPLPCFYPYQVTPNDSVLALRFSDLGFQPLQKIVYANEHLFAAGTNAIYKMRRDSMRVLQTLVLTEEKMCVANCSTVITGLQIYNRSHLVVCLTHHGQCILVNTEHLSVVSSSPRNIVTNNIWDGTVAITAGTVKYSNKTTEKLLWMFSSISHADNITMAVRHPDTFTIYSAINSSILDILNNQMEKTLQYVYAFEDQMFVFYIKNINSQAYIGGTCKNDASFDTLTEIPLTCTSRDGESRGLLRAAYISKAGNLLLDTLRSAQEPDALSSDSFLFGVFAANSNATSSSICVYRIISLIEKMESVFKECHVDGINDNVLTGPVGLVHSTDINCTSLVSKISNTV